jgi:hypothetical protein
MFTILKRQGGWTLGEMAELAFRTDGPLGYNLDQPETIVLSGVLSQAELASAVGKANVEHLFVEEVSEPMLLPASLSDD